MSTFAASRYEKSVRRELGFLLLVATVIVFSVLVAPTGAATNHLQCGDSVTTDVVLDRDLVCTAAVLMNTDGVTLNLNSHTVSGGGIGIDASHVRIINGTVKDAGVSISLGGFDQRRIDVTLSELHVYGVGGGITLFSDGGSCSGSRTVTIVHSNISNSTGTGIRGGETCNWTVRDSQVSHNGGAGIAAGAQTFGVVLTGNRVANNQGSGISLVDSEAVVSNNVVRGNAVDGLAISDCGPFLPSIVLTSNTANRNGNLGIEVVNECPALDYHVTDGGGNRAKHNGNALECVGISCVRNRGSASD